jgi:hypothetical protein
MQCIWHALELGEQYQRNKDFGKALKNFHQIDRVNLL